MTSTEKYTVIGIGVSVVLFLITRQSTAVPARSVVPNNGVTSSVVKPAAASSQVASTSSLLSALAGLLGGTKASAGTGGGGSGPGSGGGSNGGGGGSNPAPVYYNCCIYPQGCGTALTNNYDCNVAQCALSQAAGTADANAAIDAQLAAVAAQLPEPSCSQPSPDCSASTGCCWSGPANACVAGCLQGCYAYSCCG